MNYQLLESLITDYETNFCDSSVIIKTLVNVRHIIVYAKFFISFI